jgi:cGMP-dependent protein kinase 1
MGLCSSSPSNVEEPNTVRNEQYRAKENSVDVNQQADAEERPFVPQHQDSESNIPALQKGDKKSSALRLVDSMSRSHNALDKQQELYEEMMRDEQKAKEAAAAERKSKDAESANAFDYDAHTKANEEDVDSQSHSDQPTALSASDIDMKIIQSIPLNYKLGAKLKKVPLLARLDEDERAKLGGALRKRTYGDGAIIIEQDTEGDKFYIVAKGKAIVSKFMPDVKKHQDLATLNPGDYFGEHALLSNAKRGARVRAFGQCVCLYLDRAKFKALFGATLKKVQFVHRKAISAETTRRQVSDFAPKNVDRDKSSEVATLIYTAVTRCVLFRNLDEEQKRGIVEEFWRVPVKDGHTIIRQGDAGDNFYIVEDGNFDIFVKKQGQDPVRVAQRGARTSFGELALMYNAPRAATVTATCDSVVWAVDRYTFRRFVAKLSEQKLRDMGKFLKGVQSFSALTAYERAKIAEALDERVYPGGHNIITQGEKGDSFFILRAGEVIVTRKDEATGKDTEVARYRSGDYFGERALIKNEPRGATCRTVGRCRVLALDRQAFNLLLGPLEEIMQQRVETYDNLNRSLSTLHDRKESGADQADSSNAEHDEDAEMYGVAPKQAKTAFEQADIKIDDLKEIGTLGKGSFGHVKLMKHNKTGEYYALKVIAKNLVVAHGQQEHIINEKTVMSMLDHPFLVKLYATHHDRDFLYLVLELSLGGELFSYLRTENLFDEPTARFYAASVVLAFEYMHSKDIIYRDLKPENLLLDRSGFMKITDFGFAKVVKDRTWTLCGTPDYLAPEVVSGQGHGKGVDWWCLGIFIFEMLASMPPFYDNDPMRTYNKILEGNIEYPRHFSPEAVSLIGGLLHPKPTKRLGVVKGGARLIKRHPWFKGFDWRALFHRTMTPPIVPKVNGNDDLSNFDQYPDEEPMDTRYRDDGTGWDKDF